jgi:hypothetical protein
MSSGLVLIKDSPQKMVLVSDISKTNPINRNKLDFKILFVMFSIQKNFNFNKSQRKIEINEKIANYVKRSTELLNLNILKCIFLNFKNSQKKQIEFVHLLNIFKSKF